MSRAASATLLACGALACSNGTTSTCLSIGVSYTGSQPGVLLLTGASTIDSGLEFFAPLDSAAPDGGPVGATVCGGAPGGDTVLLVAWLDDGGTVPLCGLPLTAACAPPDGAPQVSQIVMEIGGQTTTVHLTVEDPDAGS
jgi:hypothetical protein